MRDPVVDPVWAAIGNDLAEYISVLIRRPGLPFLDRTQRTERENRQRGIAVFWLVPMRVIFAAAFR